MKLTTAPLHHANADALTILMNHPLVGEHLPLLQGRFTEEICAKFLCAKADLWRQHGFGPYAFYVDGVLAGWGGLQQEGEEVDFALVLHPNYWGIGRRIFAMVKQQAFESLGLPSITALLPPGRKNAMAIKRFGFVAEGMCEIQGISFTQFRLKRP